MWEILRVFFFFFFFFFFDRVIGPWTFITGPLSGYQYPGTVLYCTDRYPYVQYLIDLPLPLQYPL